jgi:chemotaxis protein methyltransferase CheR
MNERSGFAMVKPQVRSMTRFSYMNLVSQEWGAMPRTHVVFCRNVMIYFNAVTRKRLLERLHSSMLPGALLFIGHSENCQDARQLFEPIGRTVYRRIGPA